MILTQLVAYLRQHRSASIAEMSIGLNTTPEVLNAMLATLERKGRVRRLPANPACGHTCCKCDPNTLALFEWTEQLTHMDGLNTDGLKIDGSNPARLSRENRV